MTSKPPLYDEALFGILQNEGQIAPFLDAIFEFLYRRTDFYQLLTADGKLGFPPGSAEKLVTDAFKKYNQRTEVERKKTAEKAPPVVQSTNSTMTSPETGERRPIPKISAHPADDAGNGAIHDVFAWNQTHRDLDVRVYVPKSITKSKQLLVQLTKTSLKIALKTQNEIILEGVFRKAINSAESMWIFVPGEYVQMTLEKEVEGWWDSLLEGQCRIDLSKIEAEISFTDMDTSEQQHIRKMIHHQKMKAEGEEGESDGVKKAFTAATPFKTDLGDVSPSLLSTSL